MINKNEVRILESKSKPLIKDFATQYVALWNVCQSLGLNDRQTKGCIELLINFNNWEDKEEK